MENLYDKLPITITESYVGYGKDDLKEMTKEELKQELKRTEKEIQTCRDELNSTAINTPSFVLKERIGFSVFIYIPEKSSSLVSTTIA